LLAQNVAEAKSMTGQRMPYHSRFGRPAPGCPLETGRRAHAVSTKLRRYLLNNPGLLTAGL
jgi:hypothetical protein